MPTAEPRTSIMAPLARAVSTGVDTASPATINAARLDRFRDAWQKLIDERLLAWLEEPRQLEDEGVEPPSGTILRLAIDYAEKLRDEGFPPPDSIVPDPNGGVAFERRRNGISGVFYFWHDGTLEYQKFRGTTLVERYNL